MTLVFGYKTVELNFESAGGFRAIRIVLDSLRGDPSIAELCRREGIVEPYRLF